MLVINLNSSQCCTITVTWDSNIVFLFLFVKGNLKSGHVASFITMTDALKGRLLKIVKVMLNLTFPLFNSKEVQSQLPLYSFCQAI